VKSDIKHKIGADTNHSTAALIEISIQPKQIKGVFVSTLKIMDFELEESRCFF
jgi:hypothetical protein